MTSSTNVEDFLNVAISVQNVSVIYPGNLKDKPGIVAIEDVSFALRVGEILSVVGPNGCGKSTLLMVTSNLLKPTKGTIEYPSSQARGTVPRKAVVFQDFGLFYWMTVQENVEFGLKPLGYPDSERQKTVKKYIDLVGLRGFEDYYPPHLSGGMQQRVALARALAISPEFLFLDEPFASLDLQTRESMQEEFLRIWENNNVTTFCVTHSIEEALYMSHRIIVITKRPGRIKIVTEVPFAFPREPSLRLTSEFLSLKSMIWNSLRKEIE